jgi:CrcB protein
MWMFALVAAGGALGSMTRFALSGLVRQLTSPASFPLGTFIINVLGCLVFGAIVGVADERGGLGPSARAFLLVGVLGGFTTFSSFGWETFELLRGGQIGPALVNVGGQCLLGLIAVWAGYNLPRLF